jgi:subtilisin family serine protease
MTSNIKKFLFFISFCFSLIILSITASAEGYIFTLKDDYPMLFSADSSITPVSAEHGVYKTDSKEEMDKLIKAGVTDKVEEDITYTLFDYSPSDSYYAMQQNLVQISAPYVWEKGMFGKGVKIAVIDSGVSIKASDFNLKNINRVADFFVEDSRDTYFCDDADGHGTAVTGIIAAAHNNKGIAGIAPLSEIYVFRCFNSSSTDTGKASYIIDAIYSAVDDYGCDIINMSFGGRDSLVFQDAIDYAYEKGVLLVASAGNNGSSNHYIYYPASYDNVISVGSTAAFNSHRATHSQQNDLVNMMAPGEEIYSVSLSGYKSNNGTSFAAPHVVAAAALIKSVYPNFTNEELMNLLYQSADKMKDSYSGFGLLNISSLYRMARLYNEAKSSDEFCYTEANNTVFYSYIPPEGYNGYFSTFSDDSLSSSSSLLFGKTTSEDFENSKLFVWKKDSLSPLQNEVNQKLFEEE